MERGYVRCKSIVLQTGGELERIKGADAPSKGLMPTAGDGVPGHEERVFFFFAGGRGLGPRREGKK